LVLAFYQFAGEHHRALEATTNTVPIEEHQVLRHFRSTLK
jgi:hypothetical protein